MIRGLYGDYVALRGRGPTWHWQCPQVAGWPGGASHLPKSRFLGNLGRILLNFPSFCGGWNFQIYIFPFCLGIWNFQAETEIGYGSSSIKFNMKYVYVDHDKQFLFKSRSHKIRRSKAATSLSCSKKMQCSDGYWAICMLCIMGNKLIW